MKAPRPFSKPISEKKYLRRIRNRIFLEPDRAFLDEITTQDEDGRYILGRELEAEERKRLKKLVKQARKNRGSLALGKLVVLAVLAGAVILFNIVFKDRLVDQGAERLLESVFGAQVDLEGVRFQPIAGEISFTSLTVADAERPMTNLFAMQTGRVAVDSWQLVNGRVIIRDLTVAGISFGTERETSGALEPGAASAGGEAETPDDGTDGSGPAPISFASLGLPDTLDAQAFVAQYADEFETPAAAQAVFESGTSYVDRWSGEVDSLLTAGLTTADEITALATTDFTAIRSVDEAVQLVDTSRAVLEQTQSWTGEVQTAYREASTEAGEIIAGASAITDLVQSDYQRVRDAIPDVRTEGTDFLVGLIEPYLRERLGSWYDRIFTAYDVALRLRDQGGEREDRARRTGRMIAFGAPVPPRFELQNALLSVDGRTEQELAITALSSDPDRTGAPTEVRYTGGSQIRSLEATIDGRTDTDEQFNLALMTAPSPFSLSQGLDAIGLGRFAAVGDVSLGLYGSFSERLDGVLNLTTTAMEVDGGAGANSIGGLVRDLLEQTPELTASFAFGISDGNVSFREGQTNLDEGIAGLVQERIDATLAAFEDEVRMQLNSLLGPELDRVNEVVGGVVDTEGTIEDLLLLARDREAAAAALQERAVNATDEIRSALEAEARERLDAARAEAEAAAREAAEQAATDAAEQAEEEIRSRIRLPGF
jgi:uncharacterized protein (TIGR03545 family)